MSADTIPVVRCRMCPRRVKWQGAACDICRAKLCGRAAEAEAMEASEREAAAKEKP